MREKLKGAVFKNLKSMSSCSFLEFHVPDVGLVLGGLILRDKSG